MKMLGLIPARGGSKGVPFKNIKHLDGKPLIAYTIDVALQSKMLTELIVSTDDDEIKTISTKLGVCVPFIRPKELAQDQSGTIDVIIHALKWFESQDIFFDAVCLLQVTTPFRTLDMLNQSIKKFKNGNFDSLVSVQKIPHEYNPHWAFEVGANGCLEIATGDAQIISRRQELPISYHRDGAIYITSTKTILEENSLFGNRIGFIESSPELYLNIDTMNDWEKAENMIKQLKRHKN